MLCANRPEGLSASSEISSALPTQCFFDTVLVPLPTWILLAFVTPLIFLPRGPISSSGSTHRWLRILTLSVYYFCIAVIVLMETVEVARLAQAGLGVGLVPFVYAGCVVTASLQATDGLRGRFKAWQIPSTLFWLLSFCITIVKTVALAKFGTNGPLARKETKYPVEHQLTDLAVLIPFYAILAATEVLLVFVKPSYQAHKRDYNEDIELKELNPVV